MKQCRQRDRILHRLEESAGMWVSSYELGRIALQYGRCVHELRMVGHNIENRVEWVDGQARGAFRLISHKKQGRLFPKPEPEEDQRGHYLEVLGRRV